MNALIGQAWLFSVLFAADPSATDRSDVALPASRLATEQLPVAVQRVAIGNAAVERWLLALAGRWQWSDGSQRGELELRPVAGGLALAGQGTGFTTGADSSWLIYWDASRRELAISVISSSGEVHYAHLAVSQGELKGKFSGTSDTYDGHRAVRGECRWQRDSTSSISVARRPWFIADQAQVDRTFEFRRPK